jgi:NAD(P)-dependent dehydrogenase (short-subunit alcohol dehydrogenase family)
MALVGYPPGIGDGFNPYPPSKGGVLQFTRTLALANAKKNIRVNCLCPGFIATSLTADLRANSETNEIAVERTPMGRFGRPEEVAAAALFLASDESSFVTGSPLIIDGGYTAQ